MPELSQPAPDFSLPVTGGGTVSLADLKGTPVVLFFYPRDDTPGCTKESIGFSEHLADFEAAGAKVLWHLSRYHGETRQIHCQT